MNEATIALIKDVAIISAAIVTAISGLIAIVHYSFKSRIESFKSTIQSRDATIHLLDRRIQEKDSRIQELDLVIQRLESDFKAVSLDNTEKQKTINYQKIQIKQHKEKIERFRPNRSVIQKSPLEW